MNRQEEGVDDGAQKLPTRVCRVGQNHIPIHTVYDRIFGDFPAKNTVYTPSMYVVLANPTHHTSATTVAVLLVCVGLRKTINNRFCKKDCVPTAACMQVRENWKCIVVNCCMIHTHTLTMDCVTTAACMKA